MYGSKLPVRCSGSMSGRKSRPSRSSIRSDKLKSETRARSLSRNTPQSNLRVSGSALRTRSNEPHKKQKDPRPINDKKWQQEQVQIIQDYVLSHEGGSILLNNGKNLRPLTNKMFVDLSKFILSDVWPPIKELTLSNYCDILPRVLVTLRYPGTLSNSLLKTANTLHAWPYILAILSWFISLKEMDVELDMEEFLCIDYDEPEEQKMSKLKIQTSIKAFHLWNCGIDSNEVGKDFIKQYKIIKGRENLYEEAANSEHHLEKRMAKMEILEAEQRKLKKALSELNVDNDEIQSNLMKQRQFEAEIKSRIKMKTENILKLKQDLEIHENSTEVLKNKISEQKMSSAERKSKLQEINDLKEAFAFHLKTRGHEQKLHDEQDLKLSRLKTKLRKKINERNLALLAPSLKYPELKELTLPEEGFLNTDIFQIFEEKLKKTEALHSHIKQKKNETNEKLESLKDELEKIKTEINSEKQLINHQKSNCDKQKKEIADFNELIQREESQLLENIKLETLRQKNLATTRPNLEDRKKEYQENLELIEYWRTEEKNVETVMQNFQETLREEAKQEIDRLNKILQRIGKCVDGTLKSRIKACNEVEDSSEITKKK